MTNLTNINLETLTAADLKTLAKEFKVKNWWNLKKVDLISELTIIKLDLEDKAAVEKANQEYQQELAKKAQEITGKVYKDELIPMPGTQDPNWGEKASGKKSTKAPKVEKDQENLVTLKELAAEFHMKGTKARRLLRNETAARPFGGNRWEWDKDLHKEALEAARNILKAHTK